MAFVDQFSTHYLTRTWPASWKINLGRDDVFHITGLGDLTGATFECQVRLTDKSIGALFTATVNIDTPSAGSIEIAISESDSLTIGNYPSAYMVLDVFVAGERRNFYAGQIDVSPRGSGYEVIPTVEDVDSAIAQLNDLIGQVSAQLNPVDVTQPEAEAGTETDNRTWSPERVKQAIDALGAVKLGVAQEYTKTQNFNATVLTDAANIAWDLESNQACSVTLAGNRTLDNPTNKVDGATYILRVVQDATGARTLAYGSDFKWQGGTAPTLTATANAVDILTFICDGTNMYGVASQDFS